MSTWFTSDTHWGHVNIIQHSNRPFSDVTAMDEAMIQRWNAVVGERDTVWHLGDFCWRPASIEPLLDRLHGRIHFVWGNHDTPRVRKLPRWASSQAYAEINLEGSKLVLFHYAIKNWNRVHHGALHLYGHSHGSLPGDSQSCDVGVDCWDYRPVSLTQIKERMATQTPRVAVDHHRTGDCET